MVLTDGCGAHREHKNTRHENLTFVWFDSGAMFLHTDYMHELTRSLDQGIETKVTVHVVARQRVMTHSCVAILLMRLMKPNVFELHAPISKVATLGCQWSHTPALLFCWYYGLWDQMCLNCVPLAANLQHWVATMMLSTYTLWNSATGAPDVNAAY